MTFEFKELMKGSFLFIIILLGQSSLCSTEKERVEIFQSFNLSNDNYNLTKKTLGMNCWKGKCSEGQICNQLYNCECLPGFVNRSNICEPCAGENEECFTSSDCYGMLVCINGICRKTTPNAEFNSLAKICLGITIVSIIIALLSTLLKYLLRFNVSNTFTRCRNFQCMNSMDRQGRHILEPQPPPRGLIGVEEKPPSYEECVRTGRINSVADPPPLYVISSKI